MPQPRQKQWGLLKLQPPLWPHTSLQAAISRQCGKTDLINNKRITELWMDCLRGNDAAAKELALGASFQFTLADAFKRFLQSKVLRRLKTPGSRNCYDELRKLVYVAKQIGMSHPTIKRVADGDTQVSRTTQQKLSDYLIASCAPAMDD